ncbi:uncharacterized protein LOC130999895 [Salvia miltiorrhiza]|uniref:uncharacterized protein LOC130999895 n=1 Tax=Salvia miltiorrhiza TaxID=226208 RepID=UPI0025ACDF58|nr:uncharacterized protein LOC130999895 [Salvia miltiorrhiza]XP_057781572.1 uncharacterized protein LOC130999895 [Salvia miltiorrhiza]
MEENCSGTSNRSWPRDDFTDLLFSWSLVDIFDEDVYKHQVEKIPEVFESVDHYLLSYAYPLLEETRAAIAASLETVYKAPFSEVVSLGVAKTDSLVYNVKVDNWRNKITDRGKEPYRTLPGDLVLLSDSKPESVSDLQRIGRMNTFASVVNISDDENGDNCSSSAFKLKTAHNVEVDDKKSKSLYVVYLTNITTHKRIWKALKMRRNLKIIEKVLVKNDLGEENCEFCPQGLHSEVEEKFQSTLLSKSNESQLGAIMASISKIGCKHQSSVELIWGPPGTGKTSTLSVLLYILLEMNVRTVICAPTNTAITELVSRVTTLVRNAVKTESGKSMLTCPFGGMLLFGNNDRLKVGSDIQEIFLDYRVDRLTEILVPLTGWRKCVSSMIDFLEGCVSQHRIYVENEQIKSEENFDGEAVQSGTKSFLDYARDRFKNLASPLRNCMLTVITHLPRSFVDEGNYENVVQLFSHLDSLEKLLFENNGMTSKHLETIFAQQIMIGSDSFLDASSLQCVRSQCLFVLRSLLTSLSRFGFPKAFGKSSIKEFCFQKASLIFCTVSSAFKLHSVDMEPFQLLVIDEAAQVKECETAIALQIKDVRHAILVGDEFQLPATVSSKLSEEAGFGRSLFERLSSMGHPKHLLNVQYRMHPSISWFPNSNFYQNQILDGPNVQSKSYEKSYLEGEMFGPYSFINIRGGREELDDVGVSRRNMVEVAVIVKLVQKLFKAWSSSKGNLSIGLISPYAAQVAAIQDKLQTRYDNLERFTVKVKSIDGFQGGEEDIIIISTVRSHKGGSIGFLCSPKRTNVALTRACHCLWILGNERTLNRSDSVWTAIVSDAKNRRCFFNADEDSDIGKTIVDVKKELDQFDDLLSGESTLFENLRWQVLFSENFRKSFQKLRFSHTKKLVINLLIKLGNGWRPRKVIVDWKCESSSYIIKQFKVDIYFVVCSIDMMRDSIHKQVLKVWDILPMTDTIKLLKRIDSIASMYTDDFINHCNDKLFERNLEVPMSWPLSSDIIRFKDPSSSKLVSGANTSSAECRTYVENSKVSESLLLMKFYSLSCGTVNHLLSDFEGKCIDLPFEVTDEERKIILFKESSFILGRSGTGKTTILTMKLYQTFQQFCIASRDSMSVDDNVSITDEVDDDSDVSGTDEVDVEQLHGGPTVPVLRQLFVTVSPKLCHAVKKNVAQMKSIATKSFSGQDCASSMDNVDEVSEFKDIPDTFVGIREEKYPLIITFHKFLMMLDGSLGMSFFQRFPSVRDSPIFEGTRSVALQTFLRKNEVTYDRFSSIYWPRFNEKLKKSLDASRVYTEIISHIKGSPLEGESCDYKRSRQDYLSLSESRRSTLYVEQRDAIYDIFEDYEKMKLERGEFDLADFVSDIHLRFNEEYFPGDKMDFVYIDEVQDLTMRQISLFKYICDNVDEGFMFSGDTAQTIARGIDFRFEDIRSLFYTEFVMRSRNPDFAGNEDKGLISDMFNLSYNFRTHTGVLRLAQSVVDLIGYFFPHSIDKLDPETSRIYGESPIVLEPGSDDNLIISIFGHSGKSSGKWVGFGADQVILVRDDSAKKEISDYIGHQALILTIVECKGLEFQDVLLYNFFGSSPLSNQWRVLYKFLYEKGLLAGDSLTSFPSFSQSRHNLLCSELKQLYVAITRTRQRLWICENNVEVSKPMLDYWRKLSLVQVMKIDDSMAEAMQRASTPEEWKSQGMKLFWEKNYEMATMCFEKAGEETWEKRAKASGLRAVADSLRGSHSEEAATVLREAAEIFDSIDIVVSAAECFCELGDYERAGRIYRDKCGKSEIRKAGECFSLAGKHELAAKVYESGNFFRDCLSACSKGNHFDLGLQYIEKWKQHALSNSVIMAKFMEIDRIVQEFLENCALQCHKANDKKSLMRFVRAFCSAESKRNFLKSLDYLEELLALEEELGNFNEASEIAKSLGNTLREVDLLEKAGHLSSSCSLTLSYVLSNVLWGSGNRGWPLKSFPQKVELLNRVMLVAKKVSETYHASICAQARFLLYDHKILSELIQFYNASKQYETPIAEVLVVRKLLDVHFGANVAKYKWDRELQLDSKSFNQRLARNEVSSGTLVYLWNLWKVHSLEILECLHSLEKTDSIELEGLVVFCFHYFGLRLPDNSCVSFHLLNPDAAWVKNVEGFIRWNKNVATLEPRHFASAARIFWLQELVVVGLKVLEALQRLHNNPMMMQLLGYCKSMCQLHIFDIAKFFMDSKFITLNFQDKRKLQGLVEQCTQYADVVFPLDPRVSLCENMLSLRETDLSRNLLEEIVIRNIGGRRELSSGQIGRAVMTMLGNGKLKNSFYDIISERLSNGTPWKSFIENLRGPIESDSAKESKSGKSIGDGSHSQRVQESPLRCSREALSELLHSALEETYNISWRLYDYISPNCFLYLLERMLILAPHPSGFFYTTKSSFVEYLVSMPPDANPRTSLATHNRSRPDIMIRFVLLVVEQFLCNRLESVEWTKKSAIKCNFYIPVLLLRSIMILCVLSVNWGLNFDILNQKMSRLDITSHLPRVFCEALRPRRRSYVQFVSAVATAFKLVGDPLVIVDSGDINRNFTYPDAVLLDLRSFSCRADIMTTLFPRSTAASDGQPTTVETNVIEPSSVVMPPVVSNKDKNAAVESSEMASKTASSSSSVNGSGKLLVNWDFIGEISEALESYTNRNDENLKSLFLGKKVDLEGHISLITGTIECLIEQRSDSGEENELPFDASSLVNDLRTLMSLLHTSEYDSKALAEIGELLKSMEARRPELEVLTSLLVGKNDDSVVADSEEKGDDKNSDSNVEDEDSETEDSAAVEAEPNPSNKGKGKNEKKNNSKKGNSAAEEVETNSNKKGKGKNSKNNNKNKAKKGKGGKKKR